MYNAAREAAYPRGLISMKRKSTRFLVNSLLCFLFLSLSPLASQIAAAKEAETDLSTIVYGLHVLHLLLKEPAPDACMISARGKWRRYAGTNSLSTPAAIESHLEREIARLSKAGALVNTNAESRARQQIRKSLTRFATY